MKSRTLGGLVIASFIIPWCWHVHRLLGDARIYSFEDLVFATISFAPGLALLWLGLEVAGGREE